MTGRELAVQPLLRSSASKAAKSSSSRRLGCALKPLGTSEATFERPPLQSLAVCPLLPQAEQMMDVIWKVVFRWGHLEW